MPRILICPAAGTDEAYVFASLEIYVGRMSGNIPLLYVRGLPYMDRRNIVS